MKEQKILKIEKGYGDAGIFYTTDIAQKLHDWYVERIVRETRIIGKGYYNNLELEVFCGYIGDDKIFEIESNSSLTIWYYKS